MRHNFALALLALLAACDVEGDEEDAPPADFTPPSATDTVGVEARDLEAELPLLITSTISLVSESADPPEAGTVRVLRSLEPGGALTVTIELNDVRPGHHAWEIRQGDCVASTDTTGTSPASRTAGVTGAVEVGDAGFGESSAMLPAGVLAEDELGRSRYSLVVFDMQGPSPEHGAIACADL